MTTMKGRHMDDKESVLSLFRGRCGHQWVGTTYGSFACPTCGLHDGDHHLISMEPIAVQVDDQQSGFGWAYLQRQAKRIWSDRHGKVA
jgi:hypothetical protein